MGKTSENAGEASSSSSKERKEFGVNQTDLSKNQISMVRRSEGILGGPITLSPLPTHSSQHTRTSPSVYNSNIPTAKESANDESIQSLNREQNNEDGRNLIPTSSESDTMEHLFMCHAMESANHGSILTSDHQSEDYHLPTSNLPPEFRLSFSSRPQPPQTQQANWGSGSSSAKTNWTSWQRFSHLTSDELASNLGSQDYGFQALLNQAIASDNFHVNDDIDRPIQQIVGSSTIGVSSPLQVDGIPSNSNKRKISCQEDSQPTPNLHFINWMSLGEGNLGQNNGVPTASSSRSKVIMNKVYDPSYAAMGLPVDPHLRMFHARHVNAAVDEDNDNNGEDCGSKTMHRKTS